MALKRKVSPKREKKEISIGVNESKITSIQNKIKENDSAIRKLQEENQDLYKELLEEKIKPFVIGGYAMTEVVAGKSRKVQKCLLECEYGTLYVRPVKENGELSGRHFSVCPVNRPYSDILKPVEE